MRYRGTPVAANVSIMFTEHDYLDRFAAARAAGFDLVESWWPFPVPDPAPEQVDALLSAIAAADVTLTALNVWAGDMAAGDRGVATSPHHRAEIEANLPSLRRIARATGCRRFNLLVGRVEPESRDTQVQSAASTVRSAAEALADVGTLLIEPLSGLPEGAYPILTDQDAADFCTAVGADNVAILFDLYHLGTNGVDVVAAAERTAGRIGHVQLADAPGRGAPGTGSLPIAAAVDALLADGYRGNLGAEYAPGGPTDATLGWLDSR